MSDPYRHRQHERARRGDADGPVLIFGIHAVEAALANPKRTIQKLFLTDNAARRLGETLVARGLAHDSVRPKDLDRQLGPDTVHQGALIEAAPLREPTLADLAEGVGGKAIDRT